MSKTTKLTLFILISFLLPMAALFLQSRITNDTVNLLLFGVQAASPSIAAFAVLLLSKEVRPHFKVIFQKAHITAVIVVPVLIASITMLISKSVYCIVWGKEFSLGNISVTKWLILLWALVAEELGWRGYLEPFLQEMKAPDGTTHFAPRNDVTHPWVFGRVYNTKFLKDNGIKFSDLRAMEDGEFNWKIRMTIDGTPLKINVINEPVYIWKEGSEHSITRTGVDENGIPQYNFDLCPVGSTIASINASKFCKKKNPFNGGVVRFIVEMMIGQYFTYIECWKKKQIFADQCFFNAKRFYHECYKEVEKDITDEVLETMYTAQYAGRAQDLIGIIPEVTFFEFMDDIRRSPYGGEKELMDIRGALPEEVLENDKKTGVSVW